MASSPGGVGVSTTSKRKSIHVVGCHFVQTIPQLPESSLAASLEAKGKFSPVLVGSRPRSNFLLAAAARVVVDVWMSLQPPPAAAAATAEAKAASRAKESARSAAMRSQEAKSEGGVAEQGEKTDEELVDTAAAMAAAPEGRTEWEVVEGGGGGDLDEETKGEEVDLVVVEGRTFGSDVEERAFSLSSVEAACPVLVVVVDDTLPCPLLTVGTL